MTETQEPPEPADEPEPDAERDEETQEAEAAVEDRIKGASAAPPTKPGERSNASLLSRLFRRRR